MVMFAVIFLLPAVSEQFVCVCTVRLRPQDASRSLAVDPGRD